MYYRWELNDGFVGVTLVCSNAHVTPLKRISTPRAELNAAVMLTKLVLTLIKACNVSGTVPRKVWLLGDSECTLGSIEKQVVHLANTSGIMLAKLMTTKP